jgi:hypothetical protein
MEIQFGTSEATKVLDNDGSTVTAELQYKDGIPKSPTRNHYKLRIRVHSPEEERQKYLSFSKELEDNPNMFDPAFLIIHSKEGDKFGYYYVVKCYTLLQF